MRRLIEDLTELCEKKLQDPKVMNLIQNGLLNPLKEELEHGRLDIPIAEAFVRIAQPAIWCVILLFIMLTALILLSINLLFRINNISNKSINSAL